MKQFAVIGLGRFGASVARTLAKMGHEVLAVDDDEEIVNSVAEEVAYVAQANVLDERALKSLGLRNFDTVIVAIGHEVKASILVTVMLKEMGVGKIVAKANDELHGRVLQKVGADLVVFPEREMGIRVAHSLVSRNIIDQIHLSPEYSIAEMVAPSSFIGKSLMESAMRQKHGITVIAIRRGDDLIISPDANQVVQKGDILLVIGSDAKLERIGG
ncbi:MAG TPA: potassium uptake system protein [Desulfotomaculum sp.]|nr:MAG: TrkA-N domain protein [Desulfotomaculum sp. 46_80]HAG12175.1 potassium uptake system protein [Desulfotomaculum sp.]HBY04380.1 potassium uptake system protein [Desulfotomaculum sp.]